MKIQIDTDLKVIRLEGKVNVGELYDLLNAMLKEDWKSYSLEPTQIINWISPITINPITYPKPWYPDGIWVINGTGTGNNPIFNIEYSSQS